MNNSVKDFGAKGDGITDDTEAFRRALMQEGEVFVPDGMYVVSGDLPVSRSCRGIYSDMCGGIILARHPKHGLDFPCYFRSAVIVPTTATYRLKCAAIHLAIKWCVRVRRIPDWLYRQRAAILPVTEFRICYLTIVGAAPAKRLSITRGVISIADLDPHLRYYSHGNHFMTDDYWSNRSRPDCFGVHRIITGGKDE